MNESLKSVNGITEDQQIRVVRDLSLIDYECMGYSGNFISGSD